VLPGVFLLAGLGVALGTEAARTGRRDTATASLSIRG